MTCCDDWNLQLENFPEVNTKTETEVGTSPTEVVLKGTINGLLPGASVNEHGHLWSSNNPEPTLNDEVSLTRLKQRNNGDFQSTVVDLTPGQSIFYRAYAIFGEEVFYGEALSYTPDDFAFQLSTDSLSNITRSNTLSNIRIQCSMLNLPAQVTVKALGVSWGTNPGPTLESDNFTLDGLEVLSNDDKFSYQSQLQNLPPGQYYVRAYITIGQRTYYGNDLCFSLGDFWQRQGNYLGRPQSSSINFTLNGLAYAGGGTLPGTGFGNPVNYDRSFWQYNPASDKWIQVASIPIQRSNLLSFSVNNKGYMGLGLTVFNGPPSYSTDFWEYDPMSNQWKEMERFPGPGRDSITAFVIDDRIYVGMGNDYSSLTMPYIDFWQYEPATNQWTRKKDFPSGEIAGRISFAVNGKGYLLNTTEFWEYLPQTDEWKSKAYPNEMAEVSEFIFAIDNKAYFQGSSHMVEYDPLKETWTNRTPLALEGSVHFSIDQIGYLGVNQSQNSSAFWAYYPLEECE